MQQLPALDFAVIVIYLGGVVAFGAWFVRKSSSTEEFMAAGRSLPGWAIGLSIFGTYVSSISFLSNPGKSYADNWNPFVFSLSLPIAALIATRFFVPFYRKAGEVSAYTHLEHRFGTWARMYAVVCYLAIQLVRMGAIMLLVSKALHPLTGWDERTIILITGVLVTIYTLMGGIEAVIWTDVVQSIVLTCGALLCLGLLVFGMPEGPGQVLTIAREHDKFNLGGFGASLAQPTFWVVLTYGMFENMRNFGIDQSYVQRYATAKTDADANRSVWLGALMYLPISAVLFMIGTALFAYYTAHADRIPSTVAGDDVFPYFIVHELPSGMTGLLIAAILAAAMSSVDSSLNSSATLVLRDVYMRFLRPSAGERESMAVLYTTTLVWGVMGTAIAIVLIPVDSVLDMWWKLSGILAGGTLGLFLLGLISRRAGNPAALTATLIGILVIAWMTLSQINANTVEPFRELMPTFYEAMTDFEAAFQPYRTTLNALLTLVIGTLTILLLGILLSRFSRKRPAEENSEATSA